MPKPKRTPKKVPKFRSETAEAEFWANADSTDYIDWSQARQVAFPKLRLSSTPISLRLPDALLMDLKRLANEQDVPYQSLMKVYLADRVSEERRKRYRVTEG